MTVPVRPPTAPKPYDQVPTLEPGDHLDRTEFERRYEATPELKKAELLEGVVYMPSPVRMKCHGHPHFTLITWLGYYAGYTPGVMGGDNSTMRLDEENEPQPDAMLFYQYGGQARLDEEDYLTGSPELAAEISASTASIDLHLKKRVYKKFGVKEYLVWRVQDGALDWFHRSNNDFEPLPCRANGQQIHSLVFPGLWLDVPALLRHDWPQVMAVLQEGLASPEHAAFVARLAAHIPPAAQS